MKTTVFQRTLLEIVENQLRDSDPPETSQALERLVADGYSNQEAKKLIAAVVAMEIYEVLKHNRSFNRLRFTQALSRLPELPFNE